MRRRALDVSMSGAHNAMFSTHRFAEDYWEVEFGKVDIQEQITRLLRLTLQEFSILTILAFFVVILTVRTSSILRNAIVSSQSSFGRSPRSYFFMTCIGTP